MAGGTFTLKCGSINSRLASPGQWIKFTGATYSTATDQNIIDILNSVLTPYFIFYYESLAIPPAGTSVGGAASLKVNMSTTSIVLVGSSGGTYSYSGLPAGFNVTSAKLNICGGAVGASSNTQFKRDYTTIYTDTTGIGSQNAQNIVLGQPLDILSILNDFYGIDVITVSGLVAPGSAPAGMVSPSLGIDGTYTLPIISVTGNYSILSFGWTITPVSGVKAGDKVTINGTSGLDGVIAAQIQYFVSGVVHTNVVNAQDFISQSPTQLVFYMPQFGNLASGQTVTISVVGNGIQFTGTIVVGSLTITFADASGIYTLVQGKNTDTIYAPARDGTTTDVNIPDPFIETAFVP